MKNFTIHADGSSSKNTEQIENTTGLQYRVSGNLLIIRETTKTIPTGYIGCRGNIVGFSVGSGVRMRRYLRECVSEYTHMLTLTYPEGYPSDGTTVKNHLRRFLQEVRRWDDRLNRGQCKHSAFWFLEFQQRGAPHFHIFCNRCPAKTWVSETWYRIVDSEDIRHLHAGTRTEKLRTGRAGTISYASKYAAKLEQKTVPAGYENVGRFWGVYGCRFYMAAATFISINSSTDRRVVKVQEVLEKALENSKTRGDSEEIIRESGVIVVVMHSKVLQQKVRRWVSLMDTYVYSEFEYFYGAEIDDVN